MGPIEVESKRSMPMGPLWAAETSALSIEDVSPFFVGSLTCVQKGVFFFQGAS